MVYNTLIMPVHASIDIGSNTLRLLIAEVKDTGIMDVYTDRKITRLGNMVDQTGMLQNENIEASLAALREYSSVITRYGAENIRAIATSAVREAENADYFIKKALDETGISIEIISGEKEAALTLKGILLSFPDTAFHKPHSALIVDIGGGSSEWILYQDNHTVDLGSIPVGVIKLSQKCLKTDPVSEKNMQEMKTEILSVINTLNSRIGKHINRHTRFIGTAGTFTTIASLDLCLDAYTREKIHLHALSLNTLLGISKNLLPLSLEARKKVRGLEPERADLIIPGIQFTIDIMQFFDIDTLTVSDYGLLEGVLLDRKEPIGKNISEARKS